MDEKDKWVLLVAKLNAMTQDGKLSWSGPVKEYADSGRLFRDFTAKYKETTFRLRDATGAGKPRKVYLNIVDKDDVGNTLFTIPEVVGLTDLADSIVYQRAGIKDLLDDLLKDD